MPQDPTLFVTGATGQLGGLVLDALLKRVPADTVVAGVRDLAKADPVRNRGVAVRVADYARPETLKGALAGVDRLLLISGNEMGRRRQQHRDVIAAAKEAGVGLIAYTSILRAETSPLFPAEDHRDTEAALTASGVPFVLLRNGWYTEVFTWRLPQALESGTLLGAAGDGRVSSAARADYADAAAVILAGSGHEGRTYELAGDASFTLRELAAVVSGTTASPVTYRDLQPEALKAAALEAGAPDFMANALSTTDAGIAQGALFDEGGELSRLIGRPTTPFETTVAAFARDRG